MPMMGQLEWLLINSVHSLADFLLGLSVHRIRAVLANLLFTCLLKTCGKNLLVLYKTQVPLFFYAGTLLAPVYYDLV